MDAYYRNSPDLIVIADPDAICRGRPQKYIEHEDEVIKSTAENKGVLSDGSAGHVEWASHEEDKA
jgi:hypothetical protein